MVILVRLVILVLSVVVCFLIGGLIHLYELVFVLPIVVGEESMLVGEEGFVVDRFLMEDLGFGNY